VRNIGEGTVFGIAYPIYVMVHDCRLNRNSRVRQLFFKRRSCNKRRSCIILFAYY